MFREEGRYILRIANCFNSRPGRDRRAGELLFPALVAFDAWAFSCPNSIVTKL